MKMVQKIFVRFFNQYLVTEFQLMAMVTFGEHDAGLDSAGETLATLTECSLNTLPQGYDNPREGSSSLWYNLSAAESKSIFAILLWEINSKLWYDRKKTASSN